MPVHSSWKSMLRGMIRTYCRGKSKKGWKSITFTGGKKVRACPKARSVFYATVTKRCGKGCETKPMPKKVRESVELETYFLLGNAEIEWETYQLSNWYFERHFEEGAAVSPKTKGIPRWVNMAVRVLASKKISDKLKNYWRKRLTAWCKTHKDQPACKKVSGKKENNPDGKVKKKKKKKGKCVTESVIVEAVLEEEVY